MKNPEKNQKTNKRQVKLSKLKEIKEYTNEIFEKINDKIQT